MASDFSPATGTYGAGFASAFGSPSLQLFRQVIDVTDTAKWGATATIWAASETIEIARVPVGSFIICGGIENIVPDTTSNSPTLKWGTAGDDDMFAATHNPKSAAGTHSSIITTNGTNVMVLITTTTTFRITVNTAALTNAKFAVWALMLQAGVYTELT